MKYFKLRYNGLNQKVTGVQTQCIFGDIGDMQNDNLPFEGRIDYNFKLPVPKLERNAKLTDYLNVQFIDSRFLVLENNFITFLKKFNFDEIQTWSIEIKQKNQTYYNYSLFYVPKTYHREVIIYEDSEFEIFDYSNNKPIRVEEKISNYESFLKIRNSIGEENKYLKYTKLVLKLSHLDKDFIRLTNCPFSGNFVSERLKNEIQKNGFESMRFEEIEQVDNRIKII
jgi:hypothetical protein